MKTLIPLAQSGRINEDASIRDKQSTIINAPVDKIWKILTDLNNWPNWNKDIVKVEFTKFEENHEFKWNIAGIKCISTIRKIEKETVLSWTTSSSGMKSIQVWKLEPADGNQTIVTTEESMQGFSTIFQSHQKLNNILLSWLARLKQYAENDII